MRRLMEMFVVLTLISCTKVDDGINVNAARNNALIAARNCTSVAMDGYYMYPRNIIITSINEQSRYMYGVIEMCYYKRNDTTVVVTINYPINIYIDKVGNGVYIVIDNRPINQV